MYHCFLIPFLRNCRKDPFTIPVDSLTDRPERFFVTEIVREKIFLNYKKEIPYSCEVVIDSFKEAEDMVRINAIIYVMRESQKGHPNWSQGRNAEESGHPVPPRY